MRYLIANSIFLGIARSPLGYYKYTRMVIRTLSIIFKVSGYLVPSLRGVYRLFKDNWKDQEYIIDIPEKVTITNILIEALNKVYSIGGQR